MSATHPTPWQTQLSNAIVDFPSWGRLRPSSGRGHAITALAFYDWAEGGLGIFACASEVKSVGQHLYACAFTADKFEGVFVDWKEGWCNNAGHSTNRFQEDAGRGKTVYSYSYGALDAKRIEEERIALSTQDQVLVLALKMHLDQRLGPFNWQIWMDTAAALGSKQATHRGLAFVEPTALSGGGYLLPSVDPHRDDQVWPDGLSGDELCNYLGASSRNNGCIDFFAFQERMDAYLAHNPACVWDQSHSTRLLKRFGEGNRNTHASHFFSVWEHDKIWPAPATRVIAPRFSPYAEAFVGLMQYADKEQLDPAWMAASHFVPNAQLFDMFDTVFKGLETLDGSEELCLGDASFALVGARGRRGILTKMEAPEHLLEAPVLDALRQARAWCGGILSVNAELVAQAPEFWNARFERREVAALLDDSGAVERAHPHFYYDKKPVDVPHAITMRNAHAFVEYSLFQENPRMWRGREGGTLECAWGWKMCLDTLTGKYFRPIEFPTKGAGNQYDDTERWGHMRERWLHTMGPGDAAAVYGLLRGIPSWPIEAQEYKELAERYLVQQPTLLALCEMMEFDADGVLTALRSSAAGPGGPRAPEVDSQALSTLMEHF